MKIFVVNKHRSRALGGSEIQCDIIAKGLAKLGHDVVYIAYRYDGANDKEKYAYAIEPFSLEAADMERLIAKHKPDVVYWRLNRRNVVANINAVKKLGVKFVFSVSHINDCIPPKLVLSPIRSAGDMIKSLKAVKKYYRQKQDYNKKVFEKIDGLVTLNPDYLGMLPVKKQLFIPNSMEDDILPFSWPRRFCLWVANIKKGKKPELFIQLAKECADLDMDFIMIGAIQDPSYDWIKDGIGLPSNFSYLGPQSPVYVNGVLNQALFLVHTCNPEGFGNNFIQAWLQAKPAITLHFDPSGYIEQEQIGFYSKTYEQMVKDVRKLESDESLRSAMGERAKSFSAKFAPDANVKKFEAFFYEVFNDKKV